MTEESRDAEELATFYARGLERDRLGGGPGALEFARTRVLLERYLPTPLPISPTWAVDRVDTPSGSQNVDTRSTWWIPCHCTSNRRAPRPALGRD